MGELGGNRPQEASQNLTLLADKLRTLLPYYRVVARVSQRRSKRRGTAAQK